MLPWSWLSAHPMMLTANSHRSVAPQEPVRRRYAVAKVLRLAPPKRWRYSTSSLYSQTLNWCYRPKAEIRHDRLRVLNHP